MTRSQILTALFALFILAAFMQPAAAHYDPKLGRWLERDPLGTRPIAPRIGTLPGSDADVDATYNMVTSGVDPRLAYKDGANLYQYGRSNPITNIDSVGMQSRRSTWDVYTDGHPSFNKEEKRLWKKLWLKQKLCMEHAYKAALRAVSGPEFDGTRHNGTGDASAIASGTAR